MIFYSVLEHSKRLSNILDLRKNIEHFERTTEICKYPFFKLKSYQFSDAQHNLGQLKIKEDGQKKQ